MYVSSSIWIETVDRFNCIFQVFKDINESVQQQNKHFKNTYPMSD